MTNQCALCGADGVEPATTTIDGGYGGVTVTIAGVPAIACPSCREIGVSGPIAEAIDRAITDILIATRALPATSPAEDAADAEDDARATSDAAAIARLTVTR